MQIPAIFKILATAFALGAVVLLAVGLMSVYWPTAPAELSRSEIEQVHFYGYGTRGARRTTTVEMEADQYTYTVAGRAYRNTLLCFCLPLGHNMHQPSGSPATASYFPSRPEWSVLHPGPDMAAIITMLLASLVLYLGGRSLPAVLEADA